MPYVTGVDMLFAFHATTLTGLPPFPDQGSGIVPIHSLLLRPMVLEMLVTNQRYYSTRRLKKPESNSAVFVIRTESMLEDVFRLSNGSKIPSGTSRSL